MAAGRPRRWSSPAPSPRAEAFYTQRRALRASTTSGLIGARRHLRRGALDPGRAALGRDGDAGAGQPRRGGLDDRDARVVGAELDRSLTVADRDVRGRTTARRRERDARPGGELA